MAEVNATIAIGLVDPSLHSIFIWFVMGFPTVLVILFFLTLNYNTKVMYSPSDFKDDKTFVQSLYGKINSEEKDMDGILEKIGDLEKRINETIEKQLGELNIGNPKLEEEIKKIKDQLKDSTDENIREFISEFKIDINLKDKLIEYRNFPAYFLIIDSVLASNATNINDLEKQSKRNYLAQGWEQAMDSLFRNDILIGDSENFEVNPEFKKDLIKWRKMNIKHLFIIRKMIKDEESKENSEFSPEQLLGRTRRIAQRIKL
ncbi:MAG: hypothetical protein A3F91_06995 [Flavobacteria bacterium RIFCSPLOWO2_12_FULL_35_11]|nr:MAG: hypothetical protein A3F91_06995 [Flavobacteria bacterium RIFCSPLOWO2_12_FULL_35_11]